MSTLRQGATRWLVPALVGMLCLGLLAPPLTLAETDLDIGGTAAVAYANGDDVRLRAASGYDAPVVAMLPEGTTVAVFDGPVSASDGSLWYQVETAEGTGYIVSDFLAAGSSETGTATDAEVSVAGVTATAMGAESQTATTTTSLNLRTGPSTSNAVLLVIPAGSTVTITGGAQNGFYPVTYNGTAGWASGNYLTTADSGRTPTPSSDTATVTSALNLRTGPSTSDPVITVMPAGATVALTGESANGFLGVTYNSRTGWAYAGFLSTGGSTPAPTPEPSPGTGTATVTGALNLRSGPSTTDAIIAVMPAGSTVTLTGNSSNGFLSVSFNGREGWAYATYLDTDGGAQTPPSTDPGGETETAVATAALNLRTGPSTSDAVMTVIPAGATVTVTGAAQNGFYPVTYASRSGWAYGAYLSIGGSGTNPPGGGGSGIIWPFASGAAWEIIQGYNGGTHQNRDAYAQYYYGLDLARVDGNTAGQSVLSPVSGTIRWTHAPSGSMAIDMGNGYAVAMFHASFLSTLTPGTTVSQGQYLGTVSGPGGNGYAVVPHLEMDVWRTSDGGYTRSSVPFTGINAISGMEFPDIGTYNQHYGTVFYP